MQGWRNVSDTPREIRSLVGKIRCPLSTFQEAVVWTSRQANVEAPALCQMGVKKHFEGLYIMDMHNSLYK